MTFRTDGENQTEAANCAKAEFRSPFFSPDYLASDDHYSKPFFEVPVYCLNVNVYFYIDTLEFCQGCFPSLFTWIQAGQGYGDGYPLGKYSSIQRDSRWISSDCEMKLSNARYKYLQTISYIVFQEGYTWSVFLI